jgi:hypothetical protein
LAQPKRRALRTIVPLRVRAVLNNCDMRFSHRSREFKTAAARANTLRRSRAMRP